MVFPPLGSATVASLNYGRRLSDKQTLSLPEARINSMIRAVASLVGGGRRTVSSDLDRTSPDTGFSSMAEPGTTGFSSPEPISQDDGDDIPTGALAMFDEPIDLEELEQFACTFKQKRIKMGFTQGDVGAAMGRLYGIDFSQTTISRFEALNLSFKNMCKLKPLLQKWLHDTEMAAKMGTFNSQILRAQAPTSESVVGKKRKKRTSIEGNLRTVLEEVFKDNPRPSPETLDDLAKTVNMEREVIRVWFCNRRQKEKRLYPDIVFPPESEAICTKGKPITATPATGLLLYTQNSRLPLNGSMAAASFMRSAIKLRLSTSGMKDVAYEDDDTVGGDDEINSTGGDDAESFDNFCAKMSPTENGTAYDDGDEDVDDQSTHEKQEEKFSEKMNLAENVALANMSAVSQRFHLYHKTLASPPRGAENATNR